MIDEAYLTNRLDDQITWYDKKSGANQKWHKFFQTIKIILAVSIPVLTLVIDDELGLKITLSVIGALIAIIESISRLNNYKDLWTKYRIASEALNREKILYTSKVSPYNNDNAFDLLVTKCEKIMASENQFWIELQNEKESK